MQTGEAASSDQPQHVQVRRSSPGLRVLEARRHGLRGLVQLCNYLIKFGVVVHYRDLQPT